MPDYIDTPIAQEARDLLPETWEALAEADTFGPAALERRHNRVVNRVFGAALTEDEQEVLADELIEFAGKRLALALLDPAIDYWSKQIVSHTAGERESKTYKDRVQDLKDLRKQWTADVAALFLDVQPLLPVRTPVRTGDAPRVVQAGETVPHVTPNLDDIEPLYGPALGDTEATA